MTSTTFLSLGAAGVVICIFGLSYLSSWGYAKMARSTKRKLADRKIFAKWACLFDIILPIEWTYVSIWAVIAATAIIGFQRGATLTETVLLITPCTLAVLIAVKATRVLRKRIKEELHDLL